MLWVEIVIALAVLEFVVFGMFVGRARALYQVKAPATTGNEVFERYFRIHYNTLEQLIAFVPGIWLFANHLSVRWAALIGVLYLVGRIVYFRGYAAAAEKRHIGSLLSMLPTLALLLGGLGGLVYEALHTADADVVVEGNRQN
ncbi:MAG TPA: MAPEG family protein [Steroidobacteraceae bacterium]|nr:MAPEG family protein [Steroidobacteraceae bacterium]